MKTIHKLIAGAALSAAMAMAAGSASAGPAPDGVRNCFFVNEWRGWSSPDPSTLYLRINNREIYRVGLLPGGPNLDRAGYFLISQVRGSSSICSALDLDLSLSDHHGFKTPLFPRTLTRLSPEEIAAIPRKYRP